MAIVEYNGVEFEDFCNLSGKLSRERLAIVDQKNRAAERVKTFYILLSCEGIESPLLGLCGEAACDQRCYEKAKQSHPILRISYRKSADRRKKEKVED